MEARSVDVVQFGGLRSETGRSSASDGVIPRYGAGIVRSPAWLLGSLILLIFLVEAAVMVFVHLAPLPVWVETFLDSALLILVLYPCLAFLVVRPLFRDSRPRAETAAPPGGENPFAGIRSADGGLEAPADLRARMRERLLRSPARALGSLALSIFVAETAVMAVLHYFPGLPKGAAALLDSALLILVLYPFLGLLVERPLREQIRERGEAEDALSRSEHSLRLILDSNPHFVSVRDARGNILLANRAYAEFYGASPDALAGAPRARLHEAAGMDPDELRQSVASDREVIESGRPWFGLERAAARDGSVRWYRSSRLPVTVPDGSRCVLAISAEVTRRIEAEETQRKFQEELEQRIRERTEALTTANTELRQAVAAHSRAEAELRVSRAQLQNLSAGLQTSLEEERARISREIHDELGQSLTALKLDIALLRNRLAGRGELILQKTRSMTDLVDSIIQTVRRISRELRPGVLDDLGLPAAIEWQAREFQERTGVRCDVVLPPASMDAKPEIATAVFRIVQEALTNVARHAKATAAAVRLEERDGSLELAVEDDGVGINAKQICGSKSLGIIGMRERVRPWGGAVRIDGSPGAGTVVRVTIPSAQARSVDAKDTCRG